MNKAIARRTFISLSGAVVAAALVARTPAFAQEKTIPVTARKFVFLPGELTLKVGVPVVLEFTTLDVVMGFSAPAFKTRAVLIPGETTRVRLVPDKVGSFPFICDVFCGDG